MISPGLVGCGGMTMLLSSSREIKISGKKSLVWFKGHFLLVVRRADLLKMELSPLAGFPLMNYLNNYYCITMKQQNKAAKMTARFSEPGGRATTPDGLQRSENDPFLEIHQAVSKEAIRREALIGLLL